jgi:hypothetical protein
VPAPLNSPLVCNASATTSCVAGLLAIFLLSAPALAVAQQTSTAPAAPRAERHLLRDSLEFLGGGAAALAMHESGHVACDVIFDAHATVKAVHFGPVPFFAITHRPDVSPRRAIAISSAGFWVQEATNEWLLTRDPDLRRRGAAFRKGVLAFNVLASFAYAAAAFGTFGPPERDTREMAAGSRTREPVVGMIVLAPAALDAWRYFHPNGRWAKHASRIAKAGALVLLVK